MFMKAIDAINAVKDAINQPKSKGELTISIEALENYLEDLASSAEKLTIIDQQQHETRLIEYEAENSRNIAHHQVLNTHSIEMFKSVIVAGQSALKASMIINGGAAAALLAFTGKIWSEGSVPEVTTVLAYSIFIFCLGVLTAAFACGTTYLSQVCYAKNKIRAGFIVNVVSVIAVFASYGLFAVAAYNAAMSFINHFNTI